ncbi:hypothetical protein M2275_008144 [Rhodococcus opacus]|nr:hypothetical protein [Rhodococcus opacus]
MVVVTDAGMFSAAILNGIGTGRFMLISGLLF